MDRIIGVWQGLGYNRRALALKYCAERIVTEFNSQVPDEPEVLVTFRGIGPATAASICAFAYNKPTVFIETNIRSVFLHHFFSDQKVVHDRDLMPLIAETLDVKEPRQWYYALMDYGVMLKKKHKNPSRKSVHHVRQQRFEGSDRQVRGTILRMLVETPFLAEDIFLLSIARQQATTRRILHDLEKEGFVCYKEGYYSLVK